MRTVVTIAAAHRPEALREDCARAAILISAVSGRCRGPLIMIDRDTAEHDGGDRIILSPISVLSVQQSRGMRPWSAAAQ